MLTPHLRRCWNFGCFNTTPQAQHAFPNHGSAVAAGAVSGAVSAEFPVRLTIQDSGLVIGWIWVECRRWVFFKSECAGLDFQTGLDAGIRC